MHVNRIACAALIVTLIGASNNDCFAAPPSKSAVYGLVFDGTNRDSINKEIDIGTVLINNKWPDDTVIIVRYENRPDIRIEQDATTNKADLLDVVENLYAGLAPPAALDAVYLAAKTLADGAATETQRSLVLIAHGADIESYYSIKDVLTLLRQQGIRLYVIGVNPDATGRVFLEGLAKGAGGAAYFPSSAADANQTIDQVSAGIHR